MLKGRREAAEGFIAKSLEEFTFVLSLFCLSPILAVKGLGFLSIFALELSHVLSDLFLPSYVYGLANLFEECKKDALVLIIE